MNRMSKSVSDFSKQISTSETLKKTWNGCRNPFQTYMKRISTSGTLKKQKKTWNGCRHPF